MKTNCKRVLSIFFLIACIAGFTGCEENSTDTVPSLEGTWSGSVDSDGTIVTIIFTSTEFTETINGEPAFDGTYIITDEGKMTLQYAHAMNEDWEYVENTDSEDYGYTVTETSLTLYDGASGSILYTLKRQQP